MDEAEAPDGEPSAIAVEEAREVVERRLGELKERLEVGMEAPFQGTLDGFDSRKTYCSYCGQVVTTEEIGKVKEVVKEARERVARDLQVLTRGQGLREIRRLASLVKRT